MDPSDELLASIREGERSTRTLELALAVWTATRDPNLGAWIVGLDAEVRTKGSGPKGKDKERFHEAWRALASTDESGFATGWLAATLRTRLPIHVDQFGLLRPDYVNDKYAALFQRLEALGRRCPDPRIARAAMALLERGDLGNWAWEGDGVEPVYRPVAELLVKAGDPGVLDELRGLVEAPRGKLAVVRAWTATHLPAVIAALEAIPTRPLGAALDEVVAPPGVNRRAHAEEARELLAQVYAAPADLGVRAVLADIWAEAGDPRGAFVNRQLEGHGEDDPEVRRWLRAHRAEWLGPELEATLKVTFANGFPQQGELRANHAAAPEVWEAATADERLATFTVLRQGKGNRHWYERFLTSRVARHLAQVEIPTRPLFEAVAERASPSLETLELGVAPSPPMLRALAERTAFARVSALVVPATATLGRWVGSVPGPLGQRLTSLVVHGVRGRSWGAAPPKVEVLKQWPHIAASLPGLRHFSLRNEGSWLVELERDGDGWLLRLTAPGRMLGTPLVLDGPTWWSLVPGRDPGPRLRFRGDPLPVEPLERPEGVVRVVCPGSSEDRAALAERWGVPVDAL